MLEKKIIDNQSPKYQQIINTADELFKKFGIRRITVEEICTTSNVSKMTFYKFFKNKNQLAKHLLQLQIEENESLFNAIMSKNIPFVKKANQIVQLKMDAMHEMSEDYINEILGAVPEIRDYYSQQALETQKRVLAAFMDAQEKGEIREDINPEFHLFMLNHLLELAKDERLIKIHKNSYELARELTQFYFFGITARPKDATDD
jgi:AcrR family transcriptional regulator